MTDVQTADTTVLEHVDYKLIVADGHNVRSDLPDIPELADSIWAIGLLNPITTRLRGDGKYSVVAGFRRHAAIGLLIKQKRWAKPVPVLRRTDDDDDTTLIATIVENLQRVDVNPVDEALGIQRLIIDHGLSIEDVALNIARSEQLVRERLTLCQLPAAVLELVRQRKLTIETALAIAKADDEKLVIKLAKEASNGNSWTSTPDYVKAEIATAKRKLETKRLIDALQEHGVGKAQIKTGYISSWESVNVGSLQKATVTKIQPWLLEVKFSGPGWFVHVTNDWNGPTLTAYRPKTDADKPAPRPEPEPDVPAEFDELIDKGVELDPAIAEWYQACRAVSIDIDTHRAARFHGQRMARADFVVNAGKADVAAAALRRMASSLIYPLSRAINGSEPESQEFFLACLGASLDDVPHPSEGNTLADRTDEMALSKWIFGSPKLIVRAAAWSMSDTRGELGPAMNEHIETHHDEVIEPAFPEPPADVITYLRIAEGISDEEAARWFADADINDFGQWIEGMSSWISDGGDPAKAREELNAVQADMVGDVDQEADTEDGDADAD